MSPSTPQPPTGWRVLVIDDDADFREFVRIVLTARGYAIIEAAEVEAGLALMREELPDLVLLDAMISYELSGVDAIRTIRTDAELAPIPLILISAVLQDDARFLSSVERNMVDRFLTKPITPDALLVEVSTTLSGARSAG